VASTSDRDWVVLDCETATGRRASAEILLRISAASGDAAPRDAAARHGVRPGRLYADGYCTCSRRY
jgi:hypothetical protein